MSRNKRNKSIAVQHWQATNCRELCIFILSHSNLTVIAINYEIVAKRAFVFSIERRKRGVKEEGPIVLSVVL